MAHIEVNQQKVTPEIAERLASVCPFGAIVVSEKGLVIDDSCRMCRMCLKADKDGVLSLVEDRPAGKRLGGSGAGKPAGDRSPGDTPEADRPDGDKLTATIDKSAWRGIAVLAECSGDSVHPITLELLGKALEMAAPARPRTPVYVVLAGWSLSSAVQDLRYYGADRIYVYDDKSLEHFEPLRYTSCIADFVRKVKPSVLMAGATSMGRSLAPRIAARFRTGITADCTGLALRENSDLVQTRPAFGGNIMAQIVTPRTRPQLCTVRYRVFGEAPKREHPTAQVEVMPVPDGLDEVGACVLDALAKPKELDISGAEVIVAAGRGVKDEAGLDLVRKLADMLGAQLACTRPMVERGWFDPRRQIGLSGRTVKPKLIITVGVSGAVQFAAGMNQSECIVSINNDPEASIFNISHVGLVGDLYEVLPAFMERVEQGVLPASN